MALTSIDTVVIGGGHAGLAVSYWLSQFGQPHVVLERGRIAERWRSERWNSLRFQFPNWSLDLPGFEYRGSDSEGFASRDEVIAFIEAYARHIAAPVLTGVTVRRLAREEEQFIVETDRARFRSRNVVVATGPYQVPKVPVTFDLPGITQLHASTYTGPDDLPAGGVLVVGSGASGSQIAEEILAAGRPTWLAVGSHRRVPRHYRGHDFHHWELALGEWDRSVARREASEPPPLLTGVEGGRDMDLRALAQRGLILTGGVATFSGVTARFKNDLREKLLKGDAFDAEFRRQVDAFIRHKQLSLPPARALAVQDEPACVSHPISELDLENAGVRTIIWATGYSTDFSWIDAPAFDAEGAPAHIGGVSRVPGLYFLGLPWLTKRKSTLLAGVGEDAAHLAQHIAGNAS